MRTLIIPAAGKSTRFPGMRPKWLLTHPTGPLMIELALNGILTSNYFDRVIISIVKEHNEKYEAELILTQSLGNKIEICILDNFTSCQAETIFLTIKKMEIKGAIIIKDSDNYVVCDLPKSVENFVVGLDLTKNINISNLPGKSFLIISENNLLLNIIEKKISSNLISLGVYGFKDAEDFLKSYESICLNSFSDSCEIFISHVISNLLLNFKSSFSVLEAINYEDWGTLSDWINVIESKKTYFIDIDGVVLKNSGKYGSINWDNNEEILSENVYVIKKLKQSGSQIIFVTSRPQSQELNLVRIFKKHEILYDNIVFGCNHAPRVIINDFAASNPYPSCRAINIPRNGDLLKFLKF